ncbi:response regulator transcription factor [Parafrankia sp. BMG5.11]|uniref:response regulator transcription factor n=1 Tax=Parafrankia sp. BMG5.11 TaxID=222540 RepID=UPI00103E32F9|nr:LuxR C-terminal-related transcriptional regulator [Parafrankia sp. BMG5.11]TCJ39449.1 helix-turn-helix transcriptional regulator [Parafrankia sp. BMG5.11]
MNERHIIHFVEPDTRLRADLARVTFAAGHHAEVYAALAELADHPPQRGIIVLRDDADASTVRERLDLLAGRGLWLPAVVMGVQPTTDRIVAAIKAGALDYLPLPLVPARLEAMLANIGDEAHAHAEARRRMVEARSRIGSLSAREREVLDWLTRGSSNKTIARELAISPRTVKIHRANMMHKLGAAHPADAVRLQIEARLSEDRQRAS